MTERTPEQVAADNALDDAIRRVALANGVILEDEIVVGYAVVGAARGVKEGQTTHFYLSPEGQPMFATIGLLTALRHQLLAACEWGDDEDDE